MLRKYMKGGGKQDSVVSIIRKRTCVEGEKKRLTPGGRNGRWRETAGLAFDYKQLRVPSERIRMLWVLGYNQRNRANCI